MSGVERGDGRNMSIEKNDNLGILSIRQLGDPLGIRTLAKMLRNRKKSLGETLETPKLEDKEVVQEG
jgi:hypothetical protein